MTDQEERRADPGWVHAELLQLYALNLSDLASYKAQRWTVTNYSLVLYAAIFSMANLLAGRLTVGYRFVFFGAALGVAVMAIVALCQLEAGIQECRLREIRCRDHFSDEFLKVLDPRPGPREAIRIVWLLFVVVVSGLVADTWLLLQVLPISGSAA